jgi:NADPH:quinone reductase-like Zn-dependent oxidoreductase
MARVALQFLKQSGFSPIISYSSKHHNSRLSVLGATDFIDRNETPLEGLATKAREMSQKPFKLVFDAIGRKEGQAAAYDLLTSDGQLVSTALETATNRGATQEYIHIPGSVFPPGPLREFGKVLWPHLSKMLEEGVIMVCQQSFSVTRVLMFH